MNRMLRLSCLLIFVLLLNGCIIGYSKYPSEKLSEPFPKKQYDHLTYYVKGSSMLGGYIALRRSLQDDSPFYKTDESETVTNRGIYVFADIQCVPPSAVANAFGYVSYHTLTILPSWSTQDGSIIHFSLYRDGNLKKTFDYEVRRRAGVWIGLIPFAWVNFMTANEREVFEAVAKQFFEDSNKYLGKSG